jgi:hypothetical protein
MKIKKRRQAPKLLTLPVNDRIMMLFAAERIFRHAEMGYSEVWYDRIDEDAVLSSSAPKARRIACDIIDKVRHIRPLEKLTEHVNGKHRFVRMFR